MAKGWNKPARKRGIFKRKSGGSPNAFHLRGKSKMGGRSMAPMVTAPLNVPSIIDSIMTKIRGAR